MDDRRLDDAIDGAVREIMGVEPRAGLRGRVLERVNRPSGRRFHGYASPPRPVQSPRFC
jgi:hypothetical protein